MNSDVFASKNRYRASIGDALNTLNPSCTHLKKILCWIIYFILYFIKILNIKLFLIYIKIHYPLLLFIFKTYKKLNN